MLVVDGDGHTIKLGVERVLWASGYPHPEYNDGVVEELKVSLAPLSDDEQERVAGTNAIEACRHGQPSASAGVAALPNPECQLEVEIRVA